jgi:simple sugar transport system ATP-binding protein
VSAPPPVPVLEAHGLGKRFGDFVALDGASLRLEPGQVHALLGENGAGKSTLVKCLVGHHRPSAGTMRLDGVPFAPRSPREAQRAGVGMVYQHFTLVPSMTVAENLLLAGADLPFVVDWRRARAQLSAFLGRMPFTFDLDAPVHALSAGEKQKLELVKQLYAGSRIVILDEPTSVLAPGEGDEILGTIRELATAGRLSVLIITHKFREVLRFADAATVLRRGRVVGGGAVSSLTPAALAELMVGRRPEEPAGPLEERSIAAVPAAGPARLGVAGLRARDDLGREALRGIDLSVRAGEIVGIAGVAGNGQRELVEVLGGQRPRAGGTVTIDGAPHDPTRAGLRRQGLRVLPEEPLRHACAPTMSVVENLALYDFDRPAYTTARALVARGRLGAEARRLVDAYGVRCPSPDVPIRQLSGGNVQRAVLARALSDEVKALVIENPCMGLDFGAVAEIHGRLRRARAAGAAILLVSADLDEIFAVADRIAVMSDGRIVHETPRAAADLGVIGQRMAGHA